MYMYVVLMLLIVSRFPFIYSELAALCAIGRMTRRPQGLSWICGVLT